MSLKGLDRSKIPHRPGVYIFKGSNSEVIYVGKAIDLFSRVGSYLTKGKEISKTAQLVNSIAKIETIVVESELEALILEANLIKKYLPKFNIRLTDDKDYLYIKISKEFFPKILTARKNDLKNALKYFGPFPSASTVRRTLRDLRKVFPWCQLGKDRQHPCFYYHLGLCQGACIGKITSFEYKKITSQFIKFMEGRKEELVEELTNKMKSAANHLEFEKAQGLKKMLLGIEYLTQPNHTASYLENPNFLELQNKQALNELKKALNLAHLPERIEGYDISNIQGKDATGSLVVLTDGEIDKTQYRKFKIRNAVKPNDYIMHYEVMKRRLNHPEWLLPQLILIDGGRGQVRAALKALEEKGIKIPIFGLAKRLDWLYPPDGNIVKLPKRSLALRALQKLRDEAHRFAVFYHRKLHKKSFGIA